MSISIVASPRSFAGNKAAPITEFFASFAHSLALGDADAKMRNEAIVARLQTALIARAIIDLGGMMKLLRKHMLEILALAEKSVLGTTNGVLNFWCDSLEDVLDFEFKVPPPVELPIAQQIGHEAPASAALVSKNMHRVSNYKIVGKIGLGARLMSEGKLESIVFTRSMFPGLVTANLQVETLMEFEVTLLIDGWFEYTLTHFGVVNVDKIYRKHCGTQLRLLAPNLPDRGRVNGDDRYYMEMMKWRMSNTRKTQIPGQITYKAGFTVDRVNCCEGALELIENQKLPITLLDAGKVETKFIVPDVESPLNAIEKIAIPMLQSATATSSFLPTVMAVPYFGGAVQPPAPIPVTAPLMPVTLSAANAAPQVGDSSVSSQKRKADLVEGMMQAEMPAAPAAAKKAKPESKPKPKPDELSTRNAPVRLPLLSTPPPSSASLLSLTFSLFLPCAPSLCARRWRSSRRLACRSTRSPTRRRRRATASSCAARPPRRTCLWRSTGTALWVC